jgi:hypothetical protein
MEWIMKYSHHRLGDGIQPRGSAITNEIDKNRKAGPKNFVPLSKRRVGDPNPSNPIRWGGAQKKTAKAKVKITLAKRADEPKA